MSEHVAPPPVEGKRERPAWAERLERTPLGRRFEGAGAEELHGYAFWGPVALAILITELLGTGKIGAFDHWPTISTTVGHLQDLNSLWGVAVVGLIGLAAFYAMSYETRPSREGRDEFYVMRRGRFQLRYGWPVVLLATVGIGLIARGLSADRFALGYAIYGSFAVFGIAIPLLLARFKSSYVVFPTLFYTFKMLRDRFRWVAAGVAAGLAVLVIHLALYPWPNLAREPATFAGLTATDARKAAERALGQLPGVKDNLIFSTSVRSIDRGQNAWNVYFSEPGAAERIYDGCFVIVRKVSAVPEEACRAG
jgi:hypothetical protein